MKGSECFSSSMWGQVRRCDQDHGQSPHTGELTLRNPSAATHTSRYTRFLNLWSWNMQAGDENKVYIHGPVKHVDICSSLCQRNIYQPVNWEMLLLEQYLTLRPAPGCKWMYLGVVTPDPGCPLFPEPCGSCGPRPSQPKQSNPPLNKMDIVTNPVNTAAS